MKRASLLIILIAQSLFPQVRVCSWNLHNMGASKSPATIHAMAGILSAFDVIALQEITTGKPGRAALERLVAELSRDGTIWRYAISPPTGSTGRKSERYAFLWRPSVVSGIGRPWLEPTYANQIQREPFLMTFSYQGKPFTVVNFHAVPKQHQPEREIKFFRYLPACYPGCHLLFAGDFNCPESHTVFNPLKEMGFFAALHGERTTLKIACSGTCLASSYDNFFVRSPAKVLSSGTVPFYQSYASLADARSISDHLPVWAVIGFGPALRKTVK